MIDARNLTKTYRGQRAVDDISFTVESGKVTGFLGPNGAGKSTTMRLMLGLDGGKGATLFDGRPLTAYEQPAAQVGVLLEAKAFHPARTARNHLRVLADAANIPPERVEAVLETVGLSSVASKRPGKFSLGMAQRLGIAAAVLSQPKYLVLDEPANGLDPEGIVWLRNFVKDYARDGNAVFISSHLLNEIARMADNVVVIGQGKLIANTTIAELLGGNGKPAVYVRVKNMRKLEQALRKRSLSFTRSDADGLLIDGASSADIGKLAFEAGLPLTELTSRQPTLEESFLDMTAASQEYRGSAAATQEEQ